MLSFKKSNHKTKMVEGYFKPRNKSYNVIWAPIQVSPKSIPALLLTLNDRRYILFSTSPFPSDTI